MSVKQSASIKSNNTNQPMSASRLRALDAGLVRVYKVRRQFRRTEQDAALVALANGVVGAGPFVISQGVLYFRRVGLNYSMALTTSELISLLLLLLNRCSDTSSVLFLLIVTLIMQIVYKYCVSASNILFLLMNK
ncbi:hypothetical protein AHF37_06985 [Paragonimus kellicotti]|nr:hypothetical protein AHF37_06985 [Paragonimus kellicotti]